MEANSTTLDGSMGLAPQPASDSVSMRLVRALAEVVERAGVSRAQLLACWQLDAALLDTPDARLPRAELARLCEHALEQSGDLALGLRMVERLPASALNPIADLALHAATLGEALTMLEEFQCLLSDAPGFRVRTQGREVLVCHDPLPNDGPRVQRLLAEATLSSLFRLVRRFDRLAHVERVCFEHAAPSYAQEYARSFEALARFEQPYTALSFDRALLDAASPYHDADLHHALRVFARRRLIQLGGRSSYATRVRDVLVRQRSPRQADMAAVARALGMSERSLRRHLSAEGTSFEATVSQALVLIAKRCLLHEQHSIKETAHKLGFASKAAFHRAFKRWTGMTPNEFRGLRASARPRVA